MKPFLPLCLAILCAAAACTGASEPRGDVISRERFIAANVAVRMLPDSAPHAQREAALKKAGVTERQLRAWITANAGDPETLAGAWEAIAFKVDSVAGDSPLPDGVPPEGAGAVIDAPPGSDAPPVAEPPPPAPELNARPQVSPALEPPPPPLNGADPDRPRPRRKPDSAPGGPPADPPVEAEPQPPVQ